MKTNLAKFLIFFASMFSGKTEELLRQKRILEQVGLSVGVFKPKKDTKANGIKTHNGVEIDAIIIDDPKEILGYLKVFDVFLFDEYQFFPKKTNRIIKKLYWKNSKTVILFGLITDFEGKKFGFLGDLISTPGAEVKQLRSNCSLCKKIDRGLITVRRDETEKKQILIGEKEAYLGLCPECLREKYFHLIKKYCAI